MVAPPYQSHVGTPSGPPLPGEPGYDDGEGLGTAIPTPATPAELADVIEGAFPGATEVGDPTPRRARRRHYQRRKLFALARDAFPNMRTVEREQYRHALTAVVTRSRSDGPVVSSHALTDGERLDLTNRLNDVKSGRPVALEEEDGTIVFASHKKNAVVTPPPDDTGRWTVRVDDR